MIDVTNDCAAHFYDMYVHKHGCNLGKHMTGQVVTLEYLLLSKLFLL
jgi:hypothetical protein